MCVISVAANPSWVVISLDLEKLSGNAIFLTHNEPLVFFTGYDIGTSDPSQYSFSRSVVDTRIYFPI
jgi:hypothetical protein